MDNRYGSGQADGEEDDEAQEDEDSPEDTDQAPGTAEEDEDDAAEAEGDADKPRSAAAIRRTRFTRLRQAVSHPLNLEKFLREENREQAIELATERLKEEAERIQNDADEAKAHAEQLTQDKVGREKFSVGAHLIETLSKYQIGGAEEMARLRTLAANEHEVQDVICGFCKKKTSPVQPTRGANVRANWGFRGPFRMLMKEQCKHIFCETCLIVGMTKGPRAVKVEFICPVPGCSATLGVGESLTTPACIKESVKMAKELKAFREPGRDSIGTQWSGDRDGCNSFFLATCGSEDIHYGPVRMPWGSKVRATMEVILTWAKEAPDDKIIGEVVRLQTRVSLSNPVCLVFVEFTRTAKALGCILDRMGLDFLYYNRTASSSQKDKALHEFRENPRPKILVSCLPLYSPDDLTR